ncbi:MAG: SPOR domain-containing protein [Methylococcales bacterium]|nr:SPOR domain-containing protein [Methylococcales bacterium]
MAASEQLSDQIKKIQQGRPRNVIAALITQERTQKLDLLIHLITNLKQSLIICGPKGIGKTTLLDVFQKRTASDWPIIFLSATEQLNFEQIQAHLLSGLTDVGSGTDAQRLDRLLRELDTLNRRVVLLVDDAGLMLPGLMTTLMQYATHLPSLRVVFSLTDEDLVLKRTTDPTVDECHFIEIPPLSETQCGEYLRHLSTKMDASGAINAVDDDLDSGSNSGRVYQINNAMREQLYKKTQGIPGRMPDALPDLLSVSGIKKVNWLYALLIAAVIAGGIAVDITLSTPDKTSTASETKPIDRAVAPLVIPGQTTPAPDAPVEVITPSGQVSKLVSPEAIGKPDLYSGYGRAHEGDALDTVEVNNLATIAEQLKVEIMPSEDASGIATPQANTTKDSPKDEPVPGVSAIMPNKLEKPAHKPLVADDVITNTAKPPKLIKEKVLVAEVIKPEQIKKPTPAIKEKVLVAEVVKPAPTKKAKPATFGDGEWVLADGYEPLIPPPPPSVRSNTESIDDSRSAEGVPTRTLAEADKEKRTAVDHQETPAINDAANKNTALNQDQEPEKASKGHYTLQVIAFTQQALLEDFMRKHSALGSNLRTITVNKDGREKYLVVYGSFDSTAQANAAKQKLPAEFSQAWARKL